MSQPAKNQRVKSPSTTPKSNPPQPKTNNKLARQGLSASSKAGGPDAFAQLAEAAASAQAYLNNPKAEKTSIRREPVRLVPDLNELPCGSGLQPRQKACIEDASSSSLPMAGFGNRGTGSQPVQDNPARSAVCSSRATSHRPRTPRVSTVRQAKNYLRVSRSPQFLRSTPNLQRHRRKCVICRHPEREMIEELFIHWHSPEAIANFLSDYDEINWVSIYRHAYALGLDAVRRRNLRHFFENLLDDAINATPTFAGVLGAARALGCVTEDGRWVEPEKRVTMTTLVRHEDPQAVTSTSDEPSRAPFTSQSAAASDQPARSTLCGSGLQPRQKQRVACASSRARSEGGGSASASPRARAHSHDLEEKPAPVSSSVLPQAAFGRPAAAWQTPPPDSPGVVRSGTREIRLPLNSHKTKEKTISNR
ncbi:MAG TPA: hypothetical protein VGR72_13300 [Candidatus Acidoferrales bacterium]|nr:hypothetical protein [Candidatus Acidoferrales bacterium]